MVKENEQMDNLPILILCNIFFTLYSLHYIFILFFSALFLAHSGLKLLTLATMVGLVYFNLSDIGITQAVKMLWTI